MEIIAPQIMQWQKRLNLFNLLANGFSSTTTKLKHSQKEKDNNAHMYVYIYAQKNGHYLFSFKITKLFFLYLWLKNGFYNKKKKKGTQQLRLEMSFAMKSTIFTREWLKEKGNNACTYVSIHGYTYTQMNKHYFIIKHYFFEKENPFGSKNYSCRKKKRALQLWLEVSFAKNSAKPLNEQLGKTCARIKK